MPAELILKHKNIPALPAEVCVPLGRFALGRSTENDLVINVAGISRRHAIISNFTDAAQISDCGSQNGTFVNSRPVTSALALHQGDVISLGDVCELTVEWRATVVTEAAAPAPSADVAIAPTIFNEEATGKLPTTTPALPLNAPMNGPVANTSPPASGTPKLVFAATGAILLFAVLGIAVANWHGGKDKINQDKQESASTLAASQSGNSTIETPVSAPTPDRPCGGLTLEDVEAGAQQVVRRICNDSKRSSFPADRLQRIKQIIEQYCGSTSLATQIAKLKLSQKELVSLTQNQIDPDLLAYAALAKTAGTGADSLAKAREMAPTLIRLRTKLGGNTGDATLLFVATYGLGPGPPGEHPLFGRMKSKNINPATSRDVWEVCRRGALDPADCEFIIRFLALGIIAHNPRQFGINADPLDF